MYAMTHAKQTTKQAYTGVFVSQRCLQLWGYTFSPTNTNNNTDNFVACWILAR